jgi:glycosyltransferase involved in cell wall biosynthesis
MKSSALPAVSSAKISLMHAKRIAILGTVGVPANYGGFETLAENLVRYHHAHALPDVLAVYCSSRSYPVRESTFLSARLRFIPLNANGAQSILYDIWSLLSAVWRRDEVILLLGVSGALALPLVRLVSSARIITNIDGIEWRREKWQGWAKRFLRLSEKLAVRYSHEVIADNAAIATYVKDAYGMDCHVIAYGGDHAVNVSAQSVAEYGLPERYAFSVCRIEPENNVHMLLEAFARQPSLALVIVGNWSNSEYGRALRERYAGVTHLYLLDPIYDLGKLKFLRAGAVIYVHGHSAGGTNPSLVEAMHFGLPVLAFDCDFNRATTEEKALYFRDADNLARMADMRDAGALRANGQAMREIAQRRYTWEAVAQQYFSLIKAG